MANSAISGLTEDTAPDLLADFLETADTSATASKKVKPSTILGPTPNAQTGTTYTYVLADAFKTVTLSNASAIAVTIPTNASVAFPIGTKIRNYRLGAGLPTITPDGGVTLRLPTGIRPNCFMGAEAKKSAQTGVDYTGSGIALPWDAADTYDTHGFHNPASDNTKHIIPASLGITKVKLGGYIDVANLSVNVYRNPAFVKNGTGVFINMSLVDHANADIALASGVIPATAADYFQFNHQVESDTASDTGAASYFSIEVVEINPVGSIAYQYGYVTIEKIGTNEWIIYGPALG